MSFICGYRPIVYVPCSPFSGFILSWCADCSISFFFSFYPQFIIIIIVFRIPLGHTFIPGMHGQTTLGGIWFLTAKLILFTISLWLNKNISDNLLSRRTTHQKSAFIAVYTGPVSTIYGQQMCKYCLQGRPLPSIIAGGSNDKENLTMQTRQTIAMYISDLYYLILCIRRSFYQSMSLLLWLP